MNESAYTVVLTGNSVSAESGFPDFRLVTTGRTVKTNPIRVATADSMENNRPEFVNLYRERIECLLRCAPNVIHKLLAKWEKNGLIQSIITENTDGFHRKAGNQHVIELYGTLSTCYCNACGEIYPNNRFLSPDLSCQCGGFIRPAVTLFGEEMSVDALFKADQETDRAELLMIVGSDLSAAPANYFPKIAKEKGTRIVIINLEPSGLDKLADIAVYPNKIGDVFVQLDDLINA